MTNAKFAPRRLGHVNLWVSQLERSMAFYEKVCGLEFVRLEREIRIGFHTNGNSHHDIGMVETSKGVDRYGRDGILQIPKTRGLVPGLNHLGWEMENEAALVDAYHRARKSNVTIHRTVDHLISHSVYTSDPDGNGHEFYADAVHDWRSIYNTGKEDEVTGAWDPDAKAPSTEPMYPKSFEPRRVEAAPLHPSHLTDACFWTRNFSAMKDFYVDVAGLDVVKETTAGRRSATFAGRVGRPDITLAEVGPDDPVGLRCFSFVLTEDIDLDRTIERLAGMGIKASRATEVHDALRIQDPDGFNVDLYSSRAH